MNMAKVILKDLKKVYPNTEKKKKVKKGEEPEKKHNLQITEEGVVAVQQFSLEIADKEFIVLVGPSGWQVHHPADDRRSRGHYLRRAVDRR